MGVIKRRKERGWGGEGGKENSLSFMRQSDAASSKRRCLEHLSRGGFMFVKKNRKGNHKGGAGKKNRAQTRAQKNNKED